MSGAAAADIASWRVAHWPPLWRARTCRHSGRAMTAGRLELSSARAMPGYALRKVHTRYCLPRRRNSTTFTKRVSTSKANPQP